MQLSISYNGVKLMPSRENNATKIHRDSQRFYSQSYPLLIQAIICLDHFTKGKWGNLFITSKPSRRGKTFGLSFFMITLNEFWPLPGDVIFFDSLVWHARWFNL